MMRLGLPRAAGARGGGVVGDLLEQPAAARGGHRPNLPALWRRRCRQPRLILNGEPPAAVDQLQKDVGCVVVEGCLGVAGSSQGLAQLGIGEGWGW